MPEHITQLSMILRDNFTIVEKGKWSAERLVNLCFELLVSSQH
ncbi:MAG: hypothetical protein AAF922_07385 [Pseudomonadota bacterium]